MSDRVLIAGAGALGSVLGGFLHRAGFDVTLLGRPAHMDAIAAGGLQVDGLWGEHHVCGIHVATSPIDLSREFDAILLTVKAFDTREMASAAAPLLAADGVMISLQNGLGNIEALEVIVGEERSLGGRVIFGASLPAPGWARVTVFADPMAIGSRRPEHSPRRDDLARRWARALDGAGVPTVYTEDLLAMLWAKVLYNAALNPLGALLGVHYGALAEQADSRAIMDAAIAEAFEVAAAEQVTLPWPRAAAYGAEFYERLVPVTFDHRSSMLQDLERGRRTEIDAINGEIWRRGRLHGIATPTNELLTRLIHLRERQTEPMNADERR